VFVEYERALIRERPREGIAIAKAKGTVYKGRKPALNAAHVDALHAKIAGGTPKATVAKEFGISRETLYKYIGKASV
jgi:DNA invertase Pin-like site-specific DNA recombinase